MRKRSSLFLTALVLPLSVFLASPQSVHAEFVSTPDGGTLVTNGTVNAIVATSSTIYLGGAFTYVGPYSGYGVPIATADGTASAVSPQVNGTVSAVVSDGSGGWYIGGTFTQVGSATRNNLAHVLSDNSVDPNFNPNVNNSVRALALSSNGSILYAGGGFTTVGGGNYPYLVAITTSTGTPISAFNPNMGGSLVLALVLSSDGSKIYVGGNFITVGGATYNALAAINTSNGVASTTFNPSVTGGNVNALVLSSDGSKLYTGGSFNKVGGVTYNKLAVINTATASATPAFNPNMSSTVSSLALSSDGTKIYAGGGFTTIAGVTYNRLAGITTSNGVAISAFNPNIDSTISSASVNTVVLSSDGTKLYVGGSFTSVGASTSYLGLVRVATSNGAIDATFSPNMGSTLSALALSSDGATIYAGGSFLSVSGSIRYRLAAVDATGKVLSSFNPVISGSGNGFTVNALALSSDGTKLYAGGVFLTVAGVTYNNLAAITTSTGVAISAFNPNMGSTVSALALSSDGSKIYVGGNFGSVNGVGTHVKLAAITTSNGLVISAFNPIVNSIVSTLALSSDGSKLYAGGLFNVINSVTYNDLAAVNTSDGTAVSAFNPNMNSSVSALALSSDGSTIYAGGSFTTVGGVTYNFLAGITTSNGVAISAFNPNMNSTVNALALSPDGSKLYAGGFFTTVGGVTYNRLAAITTSNGAAISAFNPNMSSTVSTLAISSDSSKLYAGGSFTSVGSSFATIRLALFSPATLPSVTTSAASLVATSTMTLNATITGTGGEDVSQSGFAYGTTNDLSTVIATTTDGPQIGTASFSHSLTGLTPNTTYYFRAYVVNSAGTSTGSIVPTTTLAVSAPSVTTQAVSVITATSATGNGNITSTGNINPTVRGVVYGTGLSYGATTTPENGDFTTGAFTASITGLTCNTLYHVAAYATNSQGTGYGPDVNFTTSACSPTVTTSAASPVATSTATLNGSISATGGENASQSGFAYGTIANLSTVIATTTDGPKSGTASFSHPLTGLTPNTTYYFRAYAVNSAGTSTGSIVSFATTDTTPPIVSMTAPSSGATVAGSSIPLSATASDDVGVVGVQFMLDGISNINGEVTIAPYTTTWDSTGITSYGSHTLYAVARDAAGNHATSTVAVNVDNVAPTLVSAVHDSDTQITITLSKLANASTITKSNDGGFTVTQTGSATAYVVSSIAPGSDNTKVVLTVASMLTSGGTGVKVTYSSSGNGTVADTLGNLLATDSTGITIPPWNTVAPIITNITSIVSNGAYKLGSAIDIDLTFSKTVNTSGSVLVTLNTGGTCSFSGVTNSTTASCTYTVGSGENTTALNVSSVAGTITSTDSNLMTSFTPALNLSANKTIVVDTTAPSVSLTSPTDGGTVSGSSVSLSATNSDGGSGITGVQFKLDGTINIGSESATNPYSIVWDSTAVSNASHTLSAVARDAAGNYATSTITVTVSNVPPTVTTSATFNSITEISAILNGNITATGGINPTIRGAVYGTGLSYGATTTPENGSFTPGVFTASITSLACNTLYHATAYAKNSRGTSYGSDQTFTTSACAQTLTTSAPTLVATSTMTLNGDITATGGENASQSGFAYGTSATLATTIATSTLASQIGTALFSEGITGLTPNTLYYFRAYTVNSAGTSTGDILSTTTLALSAPSVTASLASAITMTTGTMNGSIDDIGRDTVTNRGFEWGVDTSYGTTVGIAGSYGTGSFTSDLTLLTCNTSYHYRSFAANSAGTASSTDRSFTTSACPVVAVPPSGGSSSGGGNSAQSQMNNIIAMNSPSALLAYVNQNRALLLTLQAQGQVLPPQVLALLSPTAMTAVPLPEISAYEPIVYTPVDYSPTVKTPSNQHASTSTVSTKIITSPAISPEIAKSLKSLPSEFLSLINKFPELGRTIVSLAASAGNNVSNIIAKLRNANLTLPGLSKESGSSTGVPIASLTSTQKKSLPTEVVFAKSGDLIDYNVSLVISDQGVAEEVIHTVAGKSIDLALKPDKPVKSITGYLSVKNIAREQAMKAIPANSMLTASIGSLLAQSYSSKENPVIDTKLVLATFAYTDPDKDGIYTAHVDAPLIHGEYDIMTIMEYKDAKLGSKEFHLTTVVDPEGYVYQKAGNLEARIPNAKVSIFIKDPKTSAFELWLASKYKQVNPQKTDVTGMYSFLVPEGTYKLTVTASGYYDYAGPEFTVIQGAGIHQDIELKPKHWWTNMFVFFGNLF